MNIIREETISLFENNNGQVSLTQTRKKGLELKQKVIEELRNCADVYARIFTFSIHNMRNSKLKDLRQTWRHSRFYFGKNKVMAVALGRGVEDEYKENLHKLTRKLQGQTGLLFTNSSRKEVLEFFSKYSEDDFARSGRMASQTVVLEEGSLKSFPHSMEPYLRKLGLPTKLVKGVITLTREYTVCEAGEILTPEKATILKLFGYKMAQFRVSIESMWSNDGTYEVFTNRRPETVVPSQVHLKAPPKMEEDDDVPLLQMQQIESDDDD
ncbi:hypothetical protein LSH36_40g03108 [Paralvinella palmiformis]|uniref:Ribosome assembly factor mrt4 n=1 Tax=Paralvinella palmiformis TaxID=53620 RepID=A0AAD9K840_9ANNE|nr:hypothetical protein LSH36_40g03108 [Paralvinella palmiformis]